MPQLNTLSIDIAPSNELSSVQSATSSATKKSNKDFSQVIDEHYQSQKSGKEQESSGNKSQIARDRADEKENVADKANIASVQPQEKETDTVADDEHCTETNEDNSAEQRLAIAQTNNEKSAQLVSSELETGEHKDVPVLNANPEVAAADKANSSTEQLMSFLSASEKILSGAENKSMASPQTNEKISALSGESKEKAPTELEALLKQVLGGNSKEKADKKAESSSEVNVEKSSQDVMSTKTAAQSEELSTKVATESQVIKEIKVTANNKSIEGKVEAINAKSQGDLSAVGKNTEENEQTSSQKIADLPSDSLLKGQKSTQTESSTKADVVTLHNNEASKEKISASDLKALVSESENSAEDAELTKMKAELLGNQAQTLSAEKSTQNHSPVESSITKELSEKAPKSTLESKVLLNEADVNLDVEQVNTDKVAFAGVTTPGEKQAQESNINQSRVINQSTQKVMEQQATSAGNQSQQQSQEQSTGKEAQNQFSNLSSNEELAKNEVVLKEKPFSELFDKKIASSSIESALNREMHQVNEATKSAASAEEMITKLSSDSVQSSAQSISNAKQITSLQNEALSVYRKDFTGALKDKVMVMMNQKLQQVEIRLDPQELGNVNVKINLQNEQAIVNFTVQNQQAKEAFDQSLGRLKDMLAESGVDVGDANVEQQNKQNDGEALAGNQQGTEGELASNEFSELNDTQTLNLIKGSSTGVDYYA